MGLLTFFILQLVGRLGDYRNRIKSKAEQVVVARFKELHSDDADAIYDRNQRMEFGAEWCSTSGNDWKFIWKGYDQSPVSHGYVPSPPTLT